MFEPSNYYDENDTNLLGGEACMWSELNTPENVFFKVWPKLAVISGIFWSPKVDGAINWGDVVEELVKFKDFIGINGIPANKISSRYCERHPQEVFKRFQESIGSQSKLSECAKVTKKCDEKTKEEIAKLVTSAF
mmetsp:Transcript_2117/g.2707  ORF Transcript_2117/g.2707 Transcript_2117/m.2707 type:complete len:135 (+) Transcript_2117:1377-1781(+)